MQTCYIGIDIGGTKTAVIFADANGSIRGRVAFPTLSCEETLEKVETLILTHLPACAIGISCGGPLDEEKGLILSPPNLPGWDNVPIKERWEKRFGIPVGLCNDANACALAEWKFGAGRGCRNMIFLTFGTGLGAGLILDGHLYRGTNGNAGEVGHIRMDQNGPVGYGKPGSWEGFCSGGGLKQLGIAFAKEAFSEGRKPLYCQAPECLSEVTAKNIAEAANAGDPDAIRTYRICAEKFGTGLSVLIDILNPEVIVVGSIFTRAENLLRKTAEEVIAREALPFSSAVCRILPAKLGEKIGDYAAISVAMEVAK